jgi:hypothetical protein
MDDDKRLSDREAYRFKTGLSEMEERFRHRQLDIPLTVRRCLVDRFKKPVTLMCRMDRE